MASPKKAKERPTRSSVWFNLWWLLGLTIIAVIGTGVLVWCRWDMILPWAQEVGGSKGGVGGKPGVESVGRSATETQGETLRNMALALGGAAAFFIGLPLAVWRSIVAHKQTKIANEQAATAIEQSKTANEQTKTANEQTRIANKQAETAERGLNNERYQRGAEMLGSDTLATRIGGVYALGRLAQEHPEEYHMQIIRVLCTFVRNSEKHGRTALISSEGSKNRCPDDVEAAMQVIGRRSDKQIAIQMDAGYRLDLMLCGLVGVRLYKANLSGAILFKTDFSYAYLERANLSNTTLSKVNLSDVDLKGADFSGANLSNTNFTNASNVTQAQFVNTYIAEGAEPPKFDGVIDIDTGQQLVWQGKVKVPIKRQ